MSCLRTPWPDLVYKTQQSKSRYIQYIYTVYEQSLSNWRRSLGKLGAVALDGVGLLADHLLLDGCIPLWVVEGVWGGGANWRVGGVAQETVKKSYPYQ